MQSLQQEERLGLNEAFAVSDMSARMLSRKADQWR